MPYPSAYDVIRRAAELDFNQIIAFAYSGMNARIPTDRKELNDFVDTATRWMQSNHVDQPEFYVFLYGYVQSHGTFPFTYQSGLDWMAQHGMYDAVTGQLTGRVPAPGEGYPPGGGPVTHNCPPGTIWNETAQACVAVGGGTTTSGGILEQIMSYVRAHPVQTGVIGLVGYIVFMMPRRR